GRLPSQRRVSTRRACPLGQDASLNRSSPPYQRLSSEGWLSVRLRSEDCRTPGNAGLTGILASTVQSGHGQRRPKTPLNQGGHEVCPQAFPILSGPDSVVSYRLHE